MHMCTLSSFPETKVGGRQGCNSHLWFGSSFTLDILIHRWQGGLLTGSPTVHLPWTWLGLPSTCVWYFSTPMHSSPMLYREATRNPHCWQVWVWCWPTLSPRPVAAPRFVQCCWSFFYSKYAVVYFSRDGFGSLNVCKCWMLKGCDRMGVTSKAILRQLFSMARVELVWAFLNTERP